jgi:hypothetical protein
MIARNLPARQGSFSGVALWLAVATVGAGFAPLECSADQPVVYNRDIRPILSNLCNKCHGFDDKERKAELRLDTEAGQRGALPSGVKAVVPGDAAASELLARIVSTDPNEVMPPPSTGKKVTPAQAELIKKWIEQGAAFQEHWSFVPPLKSAVPETKFADKAKNEIDRFVFARLEAAGLAPSGEADRVTLIRRVTLDLTGLPPSPAEVDAFVSDTAPDAYERLVDRLLNTPRHAEHMARYWLDAARYGDTHGLHLDNERSLWPYRDWVINAFAKNQPFDQFTVEQLAGDLLPNASLDQKVATGFHRCNVSTSEGGSIDEEVRVRYAVDRVETTSTVWLGMTLGCAVCHNHKFDPVTQKEFYGLFAFFNGVAENAMDGNALLPPPLMKLPTTEQSTKLAALDVELAEVRKTIGERLAEVKYEEPVDAASPGTEPREFVWFDDDPPNGANLQGDTPWEFVTKDAAPVFSGNKATKRKAAGLSQHFFTGANPGLNIGAGDTLFAYVYLDPADMPKAIMLQFNDGSWEHRAYWGENVIAWGAENTAARVAMGPLPEPGSWVRLEVPAEKVGLKAGSSLNGWAFTQHAGTVYWDKPGIVTKVPQAGQSFESQKGWEAYDKTLAQSKTPQNIRDLIKIEADKRNDGQKAEIRNYFLEHVYAKTRDVFGPLHTKLGDLQKQKTDLDGAIPATMVMADMPQPRETFLLIRGAYDKKGEKVEPGVPSIFPPMAADIPKNRLGLAKWLVRRDHPLTARVTVNRFWQQFFGTGLVKTSEDFGSQGAMPTHPELLDWLAVEFMDSGWDMRRMLKQMVLSSTYRQSSRLTPDLLARDPSNELLARGARFRLDAETIRDGALFSSGLLVERLGGKSVKPYQPDGLWEAVAFVGSTTSMFKQDAGDALYRRSLYTFWKRTSPPPTLLTFDAPSRETCAVRRARTNTPLQALILMNDKQYVEAARRMAQRLFAEAGPTPEERITLAFRLATGRTPTADEIAVARDVYMASKATFAANTDAANKLLAYGDSPRESTLDPVEHAAWTMLCNLVLNLDEVVMKE